MARLRIALFIAVLLLTVFTLPGTAQLPVPGGPPPPPPLPTALFGRVLSVSEIYKNGAPIQQANLALLVRADTPDAPGKVPDDMAQQAAQMRTMADDMEHPYKDAKRPIPPDVADKARRLRDMATELLRWRQIDRTIDSTTAPPIEGVQRVPLDDVPIGIRVHVFARATKPVPPGQIPTDHLLVTKDVVHVSPGTATLLRRQTDVSGRNTFFELVGDVVKANPLTIVVGANADAGAGAVQNGLKLEFETPEHLGLIERIPQVVSDLFPGERFSAAVKMKSALDLDTIQRLLVFINVDAVSINDDERGVAEMHPLVDPPVMRVAGLPPPAP
jgi:hypothetical protein